MIQMTKTKYIPIFLLVVTIICSCAKLSDNGKIDGKWHLVELYSKNSPSDETYTEFHQTYDKGIYWMFQMQLLNIRTKTVPENVYSRDIIARFKYMGNKLHITQTYVHFRDRDSLITDPNTT